MTYNNLCQTADAFEQIKVPPHEQNKERLPQVARGMSRLGRNIAQVTSELDRLTERLSPILRLPEPSSPDKIQVDSEKLCPLASYIEEHINAVDRLYMTLHSIHEQLEL